MDKQDHSSMPRPPSVAYPSGTDTQEATRLLDEQVCALTRAADDLIKKLNTLSDDERRLTHLRTAAFCAYEAQRIYGSGQPRWARILQNLFLLGTCLAPIIVIFYGGELRAVIWDVFGIGSTLVLLYITYGVYTFKISRKIISRIFKVFGIFPATATPLLPASVLSQEEQLRSDDRELTAFIAVVFLTIGTIIGGFALYQLRELYELAATTHDQLQYNSTYVRYFIAVAALAMLFIFMDATVAAFDQSHAETFVASSSAAYATVPMMIGVSLIGAYLLLEYLAAQYVYLNPEPALAMSVDFASGALTFQMIMSNILFIFMKKNFFFFWMYSSIVTTRRF